MTIHLEEVASVQTERRLLEDSVVASLKIGPITASSAVLHT